MAFKIIAGPHLNDLALAFAAPTLSPAAATGFSSEMLRDGRASVPGMFAAAAEDSTITCDKNLVGGGDAEATAAAASWLPFTTGTVTRTTDTPYAWSYALSLTPAITNMVAVQDVTVRPGSRCHVTAAAYGYSSNTAKVVIRNRRTGKFLLPAGTWTTATDYSSATPFVSSNTASWVFQEADCYVESVAACLDDSVPLRVYLIANGGEVHFDDVLIWPWTDWLSVHGHNFPPHVVPTFQKSDDASSWTTVITPTVVRDAFYSTFTAFEARYVRLLLDGRPDTGDLMYVGELVVGQAIDLLRNPAWGGSLKWTERQARYESAVGDEWVHLHGARPQRTLALEMLMVEQDEYEQVRDAIFRGSRGGANLIVVAPYEMDPTVVILGRVRDSIAIELTDPDYASRTAGHGGFRRSELEVVESALPSMTRTAETYDAPIAEE